MRVPSSERRLLSSLSPDGPLMWFERLWQVTVTLPEPRLCTADKLQLYHANKGSKDCDTASVSAGDNPIHFEALSSKHYPGICISDCNLWAMTPVLLSMRLRRNIDISTHLIWNSTKQVQVQVVRSSYTEAFSKVNFPDTFIGLITLLKHSDHCKQENRKKRHQLRLRTAPDFKVCQAF